MRASHVSRIFVRRYRNFNALVRSESDHDDTAFVRSGLLHSGLLSSRQRLLFSPCQTSSLRQARLNRATCPLEPCPVPTTVSPEMQALASGPLAGNWDSAPTTTDEWRKLSAPSAGRNLPALRERFGVKTEAITVNGVNAFMVTPQNIAPENRNRLLVHMHGGCYVLQGGETATSEAIYMAGFGHFRVLSVDYRRPPDAPIRRHWTMGSRRGRRR